MRHHIGSRVTHYFRCNALRRTVNSILGRLTKGGIRQADLRSMWGEPLEQRVFLSFSSTPDQSLFGPPQALAQFGDTVALTGNYIIVGASEERVGAASRAGAVYVFDASTRALVRKISNPTPASDDTFGGYMAASGDLLAVSAHQDSTAGTAAGAVYVYSLSTGALLQTIINPDGDAVGDRFGAGVAISGTNLLIGAYLDDPIGFADAGHAYLFNAATGAVLRSFANPNPQTNARFGLSLAINGNHILIAASHHDGAAVDSGIVYEYSTSSGQPVRTIDNPDSASSAANDHFGDALAVAGDNIVVGVADDEVGAFTNAGRVFVYSDLSGTILHNIPNPFPSNSSGIAENFGQQVAISGNNIVVGTRTDDGSGVSDSGTAYVYSALTGLLVRTIDNPNPAPNDWFADSIAVSDSLVVVGSVFDGPFDSPHAGAAFLFNATTGAPVATLLNPTPTSGNASGSNVAVSGNYIVSANQLDDIGGSDSGSVSIYDRNTGRMIRTLYNPTPASDDRFGQDIAVDGDYLVVGAYLDDTRATNAGAVYVYSVSTGSLLRTILNPQPSANAGGDQFGISVALSGTNLVVGSAFNDLPGAEDAGTAYVFDVGVGGSPVRTFDNPTPQTGSIFGGAVSVNGDIVAVGAPEHSSSAAGSGTVFLFSVNSGGAPIGLPGVIPNPDSGAAGLDDEFGSSVALSSSYLVVGAPQDDFGTPLQNPGSAYVFSLANGGLVRKIVNPFPDPTDEFSHLVATIGDIAVIGARADDTTATNSGSVYLFSISTGILEKVIANPSPAHSDFFGDGLAASGNTIVVGSYADDINGAIDAGAAYVYENRTFGIAATGATTLAEGATATIQVSRTGAINVPVRVNLAISGSAQGGVDYGAVGPLVDTFVDIPAGQTSVLFNVPILDDSDSEYDETLVVSVSSILGATDFTVDPDNVAASFTILDTDKPIVEVENESYAGQDFTGVEGSGDTARFRLHRYGVRSSPLTVNVDFSGTATLEGDYSVTGGSISLSQQFTFPANASTIDVILSPINDAEQEGIEWVVLSLASGAAYTSLQSSPTAARATILDDEIPTIQLSSTDLTLTEAGPTTATVTLTRVGGSVGVSQVVNFKLSGTASLGDFTVQNATQNAGTGVWSATIPAGQASLDVFVRAVDDSNAEADETIVVDLADGNGYRRHPTLQELQLTNVDNDRPTVTVTATDPTAAEPGSNTGTFTLTRSGVLTAPLTVSVSFGGNAIFGRDYESLPFTYTFLANQPTINVNIVPRRDSATEPSEQVQMTLLAGGDYTVGALGVAGINILDQAAGATLASFDWSMPPRYGRDDNGNGRIDLPNTFAYANPTGGFGVVFDASSTSSSQGIASYAWSIWDSAGNLVRTQTTVSPTYPTNLPQGQYEVRLTVTDTSGVTSRETQLVNVKDILILAMGDSFTSGEGNPEVSANNALPSVIPYSNRFLPQGTWADGLNSSGNSDAAGAHRSTKAAAAQAALALENADPKTSVTFVFVAQSGATVDRGTPGDEGGLTVPKDTYFGQTSPQLSQIDQAKSIIGSRQVDAAIMSIGANDIGFAKLMAAYVGRVLIEIDYFFGSYTKHSTSIAAIDAKFAPKLNDLPRRYSVLAQTIHSVFGSQLPDQNIYLMQYPDITRDSNGNTGDSLMADASSNIDIWSIPEVAAELDGLSWVESTIFDLFGSIADWPPRVDAEEAAFAREHTIAPLNAAIAAAASTYGWNLVTAPSSFSTHGYSASDSWFVTATQSRQRQGGNAYAPAGAAHPSQRGHQEIANKLLSILGASGPSVDLPSSVQMGEGTSLNVTALASGTDLGQLEWDLDYDGQSFSTDLLTSAGSVSIPFGLAAPAVQRVAVRVSDRLGRTATDVMEVQIVPAAIVRIRDEVSSINLGEPFRFNLQSTNAPNDPISYWKVDWSDGTGVETLPGNWTGRTHTYTSPGTYNIQCWAADAGGEYQVFGSTVQVLNTSPMPVVAIQSVADASEATPGSPGRFIISRTGATNVPLGVYLALSSGAGKAINGVDYERIPLSVFIPAGQSSVTIDITPIQDNQEEGIELVDVTVLPSSLYSQGQPTATVKIVDGPNIDLSTVTGRVFNDLNGNGAIDVGELGLAGRRVFDDLNSNGTYETGEPFVLTDSSGNYLLGSLLSGTHSIVLESVAGYVFTTPKSVTVTIGVGDTVSGVDFGSAQPANVSGTVFVDTNLDGVLSAGEQPLGGWTVFVDQNFDGQLNPGEPNSISDGSGSYLVTGGVPGTLLLRAIGPTGWTPTNGDTGGAVAVIATGNQVVTGANLGERREAPAVGALIPSSSTIQSGSNLTLEATNIDAATSIVRFYRESNGIAGLQTGTSGDTSIGNDYSASDDWGIVFRAGLNAGTYVFYATAEDGYGFVGSPQNATVVVTGNPGATVVSIRNVNDAIKENGTIGGSFEIRRTGSNASDLVVNIGSNAGAGLATPGIDYSSLPSTITIPAGQDSVRIQAYAVDDGVAESLESIRVGLQAGVGYSIGSNSSANVVIRDSSSSSVVAVTSAAYDYDTYPPAMRFSMSESVAQSLSRDDLILINLTTGQTIPSNQVGFAYDPSTSVARVYFVGTGSTRVLPDGNYRLIVVAGGVTGPTGQPFDGNNDGVGGDNLVSDFFVLAGDMNHDRTVNFDDLLRLAQNYGRVGQPFSQGNFDYDTRGRVDFDDLLILAQRYGHTILADGQIVTSNSSFQSEWSGAMGSAVYRRTTTVKTRGMIVDAILE